MTTRSLPTVYHDLALALRDHPRFATSRMHTGRWVPHVPVAALTAARDAGVVRLRHEMLAGRFADAAATYGAVLTVQLELDQRARGSDSA